MDGFFWPAALSGHDWYSMGFQSIVLHFCEDATFATYVDMAEYNRRAVNGLVVTKVSRPMSMSFVSSH